MVLKIFLNLVTMKSRHKTVIVAQKQFTTTFYSTTRHTCHRKSLEFNPNVYRYFIYLNGGSILHLQVGLNGYKFIMGLLARPHVHVILYTKLTTFKDGLYGICLVRILADARPVNNS